MASSCNDLNTIKGLNYDRATAAIGLFKSTVLRVNAGADKHDDGQSAVCATGSIFTFGCGAGGRRRLGHAYGSLVRGSLGHGDIGDESASRMVQELGPMKVVMAFA